MSVALVLAAGSVFAGERVGEVEYLGWKNAVEIDNGDIGIFVPDPEQAQKTDTDSDRWLAGIVDDVALVEFFRCDGTQRFPDGGLSAVVYTYPTITNWNC